MQHAMQRLKYTPKVNVDTSCRDSSVQSTVFTFVWDATVFTFVWGATVNGENHDRSSEYPNLIPNSGFLKILATGVIL